MDAPTSITLDAQTYRELETALYRFKVCCSDREATLEYREQFGVKLLPRHELDALHRRLEACGRKAGIY